MKDLFQISLVAETVAMEAGGESALGKLAVAFVIHNRAKQSQKSYSDVVLKAYQFSCWNTDSPTRMNLDMIGEHTWCECMVATLQAMCELVPDPTGGATYYMNVPEVIRIAGKLPDWWDIDASLDSEIVIGNHTFRQGRKNVIV